MNDQHNIEETLWNYIDGTLKTEEISFVEQLLQTDAQWKLKYTELMDVHSLMKDHIELEQPSMRFTQNVMEEISKLHIAPAAKSYLDKNIIRGISLFFLITIIGMFVYGLGQADWSQSESATIPFLKNPDWSSIFNSTYMNLFVFVNIILALMLLDMYLTRKKRAA